MTSLAIFSATRAFCRSDFPGQSFTMTCGMVHSPRSSICPPPRLLAVLLVSNLLHPVDGFAVELLLDGDVRHGRGGRRPVPMLYARRKPNDIAGPDFLSWPAPGLRPAATGRHYQRLTERVH